MELARVLATLAEPPAGEHRRLAELAGLPEPPSQADHSALFLFELYPYASVYLGPEGMLGGVARDRIAGFWRALGLDPPPECDHLAVLLGFYARLAEEAEGASGRDRERWTAARRALCWEHLIPWLPVWLARVAELGSPFYRAWSGLLGELLERELERGGELDRLPLHLREAPPLADPRTEGGEAFLTGLLAPVRTGLIVVRSDLARAARDLGLGLRAGERRYALEALLGQDAAAVLSWLAAEAERRAAAHRELAPAPVADFWAERAARTGRLLGELASEGGESATVADPPPVRRRDV